MTIISAWPLPRRRCGPTPHGLKTPLAGLKGAGVVPFDVKSLRIRIKLREEVWDADGDQNFLARLDAIAVKLERLRGMSYDSGRDRMQPQRFEKGAAERPHPA
jgi:hypothetical protein